MRRAYIKSYSTAKVDSILKLRNYYVTTQITHVFRTTVQVFTPLFGDKTLLFGTRVLGPPTQPLTNVFFCFLFLFAGSFGSPKTQIATAPPPKSVWRQKKNCRQQLGT